MLFVCSLFPLVGHVIIVALPNTTNDNIGHRFGIAFGYLIIGSSLACFYSASSASLGRAVPKNIRKTAYAIYALSQSLGWGLAPIFSGLII